MKPLIVLGTGGNCVDLAETVQMLPEYEFLGYLDDAPRLPALGPLSSAHDYPDAWFVNGIGSTRSFLKRPEILAQIPDRWATVIHPSCQLSPSSQIGAGTVLLQQVTVASNVRIGRHVTVLPQSILSHDAVVGDYSILCGGVILNGGVEVEENCYLGARSVIKEFTRVGARSLVGMGAVVLRDVPPSTTVVGTPARPLR